MNFEVIFSEGNPSTYSNKDLSFLELNDEKISILHTNYQKDIYLKDIRSIKSIRGIKLTLFNDEVYTISFPYHAKRGFQGAQEVKNAARKAKILFNQIEDKMCE